MVSIFNKDLCISLALVRSDPLVPVPYMHAGAVSAGPACVVFHRLITFESVGLRVSMYHRMYNMMMARWRYRADLVVQRALLSCNITGGR